MFITINKLTGVRPLLLRGLRETILASLSGIAVAAAAFHAIYVIALG
jgi:hypothetical protein